MKSMGTIYLVGAGPGPVDLLTLRAARLIEGAGVIVHDGLIGPGVLELARAFKAAPQTDRSLVFEASIHGKQLTGCDFLHLDEDGKIDDFMVMVRPLSAAKALAEEMSARFPRIQEQASAR